MKIAYICNGLNPFCSGKVGCYKKPGPVFDPSTTCCHTEMYKYALNGPFENLNPEEDPKFERFVMPDGEIRYFESNGELEREAIYSRVKDQ